MPTQPTVPDKDGNKPTRTNEESLANSNVSRPAPLDADRVADETPQKKDHPASGSASDTTL